MTFFDKKEEVMKIELTPHGKYLLSIGKLKPKYYRFFDDNILYDSEAGGFSESTNKAGSRIVHNTPILKGNPNITGAETNIRKFDTSEMVNGTFKVLSSTKDDHINGLSHQMGKIPPHKDRKVSHKVELYRGSIMHNSTKISDSYSSKNVAFANIPQIPIKVYFSASVLHEDTSILEEQQSPNSFQSTIYDDGTYLNFTYDSPIIRISEVGAFDERENFIVTAYKVIEPIDEDGDGIADGVTTFQKLKTSPAKALVQDGYLSDNVTSVFGNVVEDLDIKDDSLSYYLNILYDKSIPNEDICSTIGSLDIKNIYLDERINCPDPEDDIDMFDIYESGVTNEDLEDCD